MNTSFTRFRSFRWLAGLLSFLIGLGPLATPSYAALTLLADEPLNVKNSSKPNIVLTVDDSTSMLYDFLPDYVVDAYCRDGAGKMASVCGEEGQANDFSAQGYGKFTSPGFIAQQWKIPYSSYDGSYSDSGPGAGCDLKNFPPKCSGGTDPTAGGTVPAGIERHPSTSSESGKPYEYWLLWPAPVHNSAFNKLYYNPTLTYDPPVYADGSSYPQMDAATTSLWKKVPADPWASTPVYVDLTSQVTVGQWCNSDWTLGTNPATGKPFATDPAFCRTNGALADTDYSYPWVPTGITTTNSPSIALSIAYSKVDASGNLLAPWTSGDAKKAQNFYETDNVIWCNKSSALWPQGGAQLTQTCQGAQTQTCGGGTSQTCGGGTAQTCSAQSQVCNGAQPQTCQNITLAQTCGGAQTQTCNGAQTQTCNGAQTQTCTGLAAQTCSAQTQTCGGMSAQTCNNVKTQTCVNIKPSTSGCTTAYDPPGCNTCVGGECPICTLKTTCPLVGNCSIQTGTSCQKDADCATIAGTCSATATSCLLNTDCANAGKCTISNAVCTSNAQCPTISGVCSKTNTACTSSANCPNAGNCSIQTSSVCTSNANCPTISGKCSVTNAACTTTCPTVSGKCSVTNAACTTTCPTVSGTCNLTNTACSTTCANAGRCSVSNAYCLSNANCPTLSGTCSVTNAACTSNANCGNVAGTCSITGKSCTAPGTDLTNCPNQSKTCSVDGKSCTSNANCAIVNQKCSVTAAACTSNANCPTVAGTCSISKLSCTSNANCPTINTASANATCSDMMSDNSKTLFADAAGAGQVCRRNNQDYTGVTAAPFNYPDATYNFPVTGGAGANACTATPRFASIPHHYWKTSVEWCDKAVATAGDKWVGYGTPTGGSCQSFKDATHVYPRFYQFGADPGTDNYSKAAFERVDLDISKRATATYTHAWKDATGGAQTITRSFDEEMQNYANWFAYYRTRIQAVKTVTSLVFKELDDKYRVGFHTLSNSPKTSFVDVGDFTPAQKTAWFGQLFGVTIKLNQETPNLDAITRIGDYYVNGGSTELSGATDPIVLSCQKNWHMLFTDGLTNQQKLPTTTVGNLDKTIPVLPETVLGLKPGDPWPPLYRENPTVTSDSASDYITHYWVTDLRTSGGASANNVPVSDRDPASWQHVNFAAMSLGTEGKLPAGNQSITEDQLRTGTVVWPQPYPNVYKPDESGVDDLWHAAINGRGRFVNAQSADELKLGMGQILQDITNQAGARSGVAFENVNLSSGNKFVYRVRFEPGWGGSLTKVEVDPKTGNEVQEIWRAADQLTSQLLVVPGVRDTPWFTDRKIVTMDSTGKPVPFLWGNLSGTQQGSLSAKATQAQAILEFLRGNRTNEGTKIGQFRVRASPLGDIVNSQAVYVGAPKAPYLDANDPGYAAFKATNAARAGRVYVGANDGMLHAFDDTTGNEAWAYIPLGVYRAGSTGLGALSYQDGALPAFAHHYYVDATPKIVDVDFGAGSGDWRTLLVGGLGKGGHSYFGIDVTSPADFTDENAVAKKVVWEFSDPDMGYSYGKPVITKTHNSKWGNKWVVLIPSGYNNATGEGKVFFVDAATGTLLKTMSTGAGSATTPSGLAHISGYTLDYRNQMTEQIYAGDVLGNFWRFDIADPNDAKWSVTQVATLTDPGGTAQPVTTPPQIEIDIQNGVDRWVFVGTGKLYHESDLANTQTQSLYAIRDGTATVPKTFNKPLTRADLEETPDANGLAGKPDNGWFDDLPPGQRIVVPPQAALSVVAYAGTSPQDDPCLTGQPATVYAREFARGNSLITDDAGNIVESVYSPEGGVGLELLALDNGGSDVPTIVVGLTLGTTGKLKPINVQPPAYFTAHRMSWRLLGE